MESKRDREREVRMNKIRILTISVDVTDLSQEEVDSIQVAMEVQAEDFIGANILTSSVKMYNADTMEEVDKGGPNAIH